MLFHSKVIQFFYAYNFDFTSFKININLTLKLFASQKHACKFCEQIVLKLLYFADNFSWKNLPLSIVCQKITNSNKRLKTFLKVTN